MKTIYFIRHALSEANKKDILVSRMNFPLTEKGKQDAAAIAAEFKKIATLDRIICSPLVRAQQTATPIAEAFGLEVEIDERLTEQELGVFTGMTYAELDDLPGYMHDRTKRWDWIPEGGGESYEMIAMRLEPFFRDLETTDGEIAPGIRYLDGRRDFLPAFLFTIMRIQQRRTEPHPSIPKHRIYRGEYV